MASMYHQPRPLVMPSAVLMPQGKLRTSIDHMYDAIEKFGQKKPEQWPGLGTKQDFDNVLATVMPNVTSRKNHIKRIMKAMQCIPIDLTDPTILEDNAEMRKSERHWKIGECVYYNILCAMIENDWPSDKIIAFSTKFAKVNQYQTCHIEDTIKFHRQEIRKITKAAAKGGKHAYCIQFLQQYLKNIVEKKQETLRITPVVSSKEDNNKSHSSDEEEASDDSATESETEFETELEFEESDEDTRNKKIKLSNENQLSEDTIVVLSFAMVTTPDYFEKKIRVHDFYLRELKKYPKWEQAFFYVIINDFCPGWENALVVRPPLARAIRDPENHVILVNVVRKFAKVFMYESNNCHLNCSKVRTHFPFEEWAFAPIGVAISQAFTMVDEKGITYDFDYGQCPEVDKKSMRKDDGGLIAAWTAKKLLEFEIKERNQQGFFKKYKNRVERFKRAFLIDNKREATEEDKLTKDFQVLKDGIFLPKDRDAFSFEMAENVLGKFENTQKKSPNKGKNEAVGWNG